MPKRKYDRGYKRNLKTKKSFIHFLKKYINEPWTRTLKEEHMRLCSSEFIMGNFSLRSSDIIWELQIEEQSAYVYVIQELQSSVDYTMPFRTLVYTVNMLLSIFKNTPPNERERKNFQLPVVIAIVFYNGNRKWTVSTRFQDYQKGYELFQGHAIQFNYYLVNLSEVSREYILSTNTLLDNILAVDQVQMHEELAATLKEITERMEALGEEDRKELLIWMKEILLETFPEEQHIKELMKILQERSRDDMVYSIERIFKKKAKEDRKEGQREERERNLILFTNLKNEGKEDLFIQALQSDTIRNELYQKFGIE